MSSTATKLARNTRSNAVYYVLRGAAQFIMLPLLLRSVGVVNYGVYSLVIGIPALAEMITGSFRVVISKYVAELNARGEHENIQRIVGFFYAISLTVGFLGAAILVALAVLDPGLLNLTQREHAVFTQLALIVGASTMLNGVLDVARGILAGLERFTLRNRIDLIATIGIVVAALLTVTAGVGIVGFALVSAATRVLAGALVLGWCVRLLPQVSHAPPWRFRGGRGIYRLNLYQTVNQIADVLFYTADRLILQLVVGARAVGRYSIVEKPNLIAQNLVSLPLTALVPTAARLQSRDGNRSAHLIIDRGTSVYLACVLPPLISLAMLMSDFLNLWLGSVGEGLVALAQLFVVTSIVAAPFKVYSQLMVSQGRIRRIALAKAVYAPVNVAMSAILAIPLGVLGVIIPTFFFWVVIYPVVWTSQIRQNTYEAALLRRATLGQAVPQLLGAAVILALRAGIEPSSTLQSASFLVGATSALYLTALQRLSSENRRFLKELFVLQARPASR